MEEGAKYEMQNPVFPTLFPTAADHKGISKCSSAHIVHEQMTIWFPLGR